MESGDMQHTESDADVPFIYKHRSFLSGESKSGLARSIDVVDGKLHEKSETFQLPPLHGLLHSHHHSHFSLDADEQHHTHHHVQIDQEVTMVEIRESDVPSSIQDSNKSSTAQARVSSESTSEIRRSIEARRLANEATAETNERERLKHEGEDDMLRKAIQEALENAHEIHQRKVQINKNALKTLQDIFNSDAKQEFFLESILAAQHVKELTSRFGAKSKNVRQFFLEAVDADTKLAVYGAGQAEEVQEALSKLNEKNVQPRKSVIKLDDDEFKTEIDLTDSTIDASVSGEKEIINQEPLVGVWSKKNFWSSLERLELEQSPVTPDLCAEEKGNPLFEIYGPKWRRNKRVINTADDSSKKPSVNARREFEPFPDKYLEVGVQEVQQSEAVRRLWDIVNDQLKLFGATDPLAYEMFGGLYDEVRNFVHLPEEEIIAFNNGNWEPEPLNERKILMMEPFEKLVTRFSVYQKAFCFLAQHFETLTPIFGEIKQAYEDVFEKGEKETLEVEHEQMEELELRQTLGKHVRYTDKAGHRLLVQVKAEAHALEIHSSAQKHLFHCILSMLHKMRSSLKLTNWAVGQLKNMHKTKVEALAKEIVSTQGQMLFDMALPGKYTEIMQRIRDSNDPREIRRMLLAVRRQLRAAHKKLVIFEADYADTVPKAEFEIPQKKYNIISKKNQTLSEACNVLKTERTLRKQAIAALKSEIYETSGLVKDLKRKPTPRPSWTKISNEWPGGQAKFAQMREGQSTREVINRVVEELSGKKVGEITDYIEPKGSGDKIPVYLRYDKPLLRRNFTASEATLLIKDIWKRRAEVVSLYRKIKQARKDEEDGNANFPDDLPYEFPTVGTFAEYVTEYFKKRCPLDQIRMEWTYNLIEACQKYSWDAKLMQFKGVLDETVDESVYHLFQMELERIRDFMYSKSNDLHNPNKGYLEWPDVIKYITQLCPNKTEDQINAINNLGAMSYGVRGTWAVVRAQSLFEPDDDGKESDFVECLNQQFEEERRVYIRDIYMELLTELGISEKLLEHEDDPVWQTDVSMHMFYSCVLSIDQDLPDYKIISYISWVYLGLTALPGVASLGTRLVDFLKARVNLTDTELEKYNEDEDVEFENCIRELKDYDEDEATMDKLDLKKRRMSTKKLRYASLRQVMDRLYNGPFVRHGERVIKSKPTALEPEAEAGEAKEGEKKRHRHKHRHHKHKHEGKNKKDAVKEEEEEDEDDIDYVFDSY